MNNPNTEEAKPHQTPEELLNLIESGDVFSILAEENMKGFNELMKHELITVKNDRVFLTPLGKEAQVHGVKNVITRKTVQKMAVDIPAKNSLGIKKMYLLWSLLFFFPCAFVICSSNDAEIRLFKEIIFKEISNFFFK